MPTARKNAATVISIRLRYTCGASDAPMTT
jgi:hypothetical protein